MTALVPVTIDANYNEDRVKLIDLNQHLELFYNKGDISFSFTFDEDDHYATLSIDVPELLAAIGKAMITSEDD